MRSLSSAAWLPARPVPFQVIRRFCMSSKILAENLLLLSVSFSIRTFQFSSDSTSESASFCNLPKNFLFSEIVLQNLIFLSDFHSKSPSFCQILPLNPWFLSDCTSEPLHSLRFYLRTSQFLSDCTSELPSFCQILPQTPQFLSDFTTESHFLSDFTSDDHRFCQFHLRVPSFLSDFI